jgi:alpha/beta superfamily hydrolase
MMLSKELLADEGMQEVLKKEQELRDREKAARTQHRHVYWLRMASARARRETEDVVQFATGRSTCCRGRSCKALLSNQHTRLAAVICHPWGPLGGSMYDTNVCMLSDAFGSITTLRFNFRGGLGRGHDSADDIRSACEYLAELDDPPERIILVGYSYGATVATDVVASIPEVCAAVLVAPPLGAVAPLFCGRDTVSPAFAAEVPIFAAVGDVDQFCSQQRFHDFCGRLQDCTSHIVVGGPKKSCCGDTECGGNAKKRTEPVMHHNVYLYLVEHLDLWVTATFGVPIAKLAKSSGPTGAKA